VHVASRVESILRSSLPFFGVQERLGILFSDNRRSSHLVLYFPLVMVLRDAVVGVLIGVQEGEHLSPHNTPEGRRAYLLLLHRNVSTSLLIL
jgi:hypothetical protein